MRWILLLLLTVAAWGQVSTQHENAARTALSRNDYATAISEFEQAARLYEGEGNNFSLFQCLCSLASARTKAKDLQGALQDYERALKLARQLKNKSFEVTAMEGSADTFFERGSWIEAKAQYEKALALARAARLPEQQRGLLFNLAACCQNMGNTPEALKNYEASLALARGSTPMAQIEVLFRIGKLKLAGGDFNGAVAAYDEAALLAQKSGDRANESASYHNLSLVYEASKNLAKAAEYRQKADALKK